MYTITFFPQQQPSLEEVRRFIESYPEGDWVTDAEVERGVIESEEGRIYLDYDDQYRDYFNRFLDEGERAELIDRLGFSPGLALHVHASHVGQHSRELAQEICDRLVTIWGGGRSD